MFFIHEHKDVFGVEPICRVLKQHGIKIAPSTYYAARKRGASKRSITDTTWAEIIEAVYWDKHQGNGVAGARKIWHYLKRDGYHIARCTVERLMRRLGLRGVVRGGYKPVTTRVDPAAERATDKVDRNFSASKPNQLWVVDFTYVPTWEGTAFTAFVQDVYSRRIVGWKVSSQMPVELPLDALEMALWIRGREGHDPNGVTHHSDYAEVFVNPRLPQDP